MDDEPKHQLAHAWMMNQNLNQLTPRQSAPDHCVTGMHGGTQRDDCHERVTHTRFKRSIQQAKEPGERTGSQFILPTYGT